VTLPVQQHSLLAAALASSGGMMQVAVAVGTTTLVLVTGVKSIVGLGPAIFLSTGALAALPAGRAMDRFGRMPVIAGGFATGVVATVTVALGCLWDSTPLVVLGLALVGASFGTVSLTRAAAADMYPPSLRARGISLVLFGAVVGSGSARSCSGAVHDVHHVGANSLVVPWLVAGAIMAAGFVIALCVRPDPKTISGSSATARPRSWKQARAAAQGDPAPAEVLLPSSPPWRASP
jgi:MFS family permease